jgi:hypothetical protein
MDDDANKTQSKFSFILTESSVNMVIISYSYSYSYSYFILVLVLVLILILILILLIAQTNNIRWLSPELIKDGKYGKKSKTIKNQVGDEILWKCYYILIISIHNNKQVMYGHLQC